MENFDGYRHNSLFSFQGIFLWELT